MAIRPQHGREGRYEGFPGEIEEEDAVMPSKISEKVITEMVRALPDGLLLDEEFDGRDEGVKIADFLLEKSGLAIELKIIQGDFINKDKFLEVLHGWRSKFQIPEHLVQSVIAGESERYLEAHQQFWNRLSRPAESLVRSASKQLSSTEKLLGNRYKNGALFVGIDGAPQADFGQIISLFAHHLSRRHFETVEALVIFSASRNYRFNDGSWGAVGTTAYAPGKEHLGDVIEPLLEPLKLAIDEINGAESRGEYIKTDDMLKTPIRPLSDE